MNKLDLIKKIVSKQLHVPVEDIRPDSKFVQDLGGDSLDTVEMVLELEDHLGIEIPEEVAETLDSVQKVIDYLETI